MRRIKETTAALIDVFTAKWLWFPIFFNACVLMSLYLGAMLGVIGFIMPYFWAFYMVAHEIWRLHKKLHPSDGWVTSEERRKEIMEDAERQRRKYKTH